MYDLKIHPPTTDASLRAWDSADEYLLEQIKADWSSCERILVVNDAHGALSLPLSDKIMNQINDSALHRSSILLNLEGNGRPPSPPFLSSREPLEGEPDLIVLKIPKALPLFAYQLERIRLNLKEETPVLAAGMSKLMPPSFFETFQGACRDASYSLIKKRARYYRGVLQPLDKPVLEPVRFSYDRIPLLSLPGVFSHGKIDRGTRFLLEHFPRSEKPEVVVDPGCGCGVLGIQAALAWPDARIIATDDNALAVESARLSAGLNGVEDRMKFRHANITEGLPDGSADLVICNPPFHQQHRINLESGYAFIDEAHRVLKPGGQLFMVANRHLGYEKRLKQLFEGALIIGQNKKYRVHMCRK